MTNAESLTDLSSEMDFDNKFVLDIPKEIIFPTELNQFLKEKIQYLLHENGMLKKNLSDKEINLEKCNSHISLLTSKLEKIDSNNDFAPVACITRSKIIELSKKLRDKNAELECYKTKCSKLEQEIYVKTQQSQEIVEPVIPEKPINELELEIKTLKDKLNVTSIKLFDEKNSCCKLKNDLKMANKILQDEIGENYHNIASNNNWRGRAQIITDLQQKNSDLKEKLKQYSDRSSNKTIESNNQKRTILEKKLESAATEMASMKAEYAEVKKKLDFIRTRYKNLDIECASWKTKHTTILEQIERDRDLINTLMSQNVVTQNNQNDTLKKKEIAIEKLQNNLRELRVELKMEKCKTENLQNQINEKQNEIEAKPIDIIQTDDLTVQRLEAERLRLVELTEVVNRRLQRERTEKNNVEKLYRTERQRAARFEAKIARLKLEDSSDKATYTSLSKYSNNETDLEFRLAIAEEQVKALETRLDMEKKEREIDFQEFTKFIKTSNK